MSERIDSEIQRARTASDEAAHAETDQQTYEALNQLRLAWEFIDGWMSAGGSRPASWQEGAERAAAAT